MCYTRQTVKKGSFTKSQKKEGLKMNDLIIKNKIYEVRGKQVMLDSDIAKLYGYETKAINQTIKRNINKFNDEVYFRLTNDEFSNLKSQIVTSSLDNYGGKRKLPYVFTKEGIQVLGNILRILYLMNALIIGQMCNYYPMYR